MIRVVLAEDHPVVRVGLVDLLSSEVGIEVVAAVANGEQAVRAVAEHEPDVALLDISMPVMDGVEAARRIASETAGTAVVMLTASAAREHILRAIDAGALGYMLKDAAPGDLVEGIRASARGEAPLDPKAARELVSERQSAPAAQLSPREREVLALIAEGMPNKRIASRLEISEKTVKAHLTRIYERIGVSDRTQAALWAGRHGVETQQGDG